MRVHPGMKVLQNQPNLMFPDNNIHMWFISYLAGNMSGILQCIISFNPNQLGTNIDLPVEEI